LIELCNLENRQHVVAQTSQSEFTAVRVDVLHGFDQYRQTGAVDVTNASKIDN